MRVTEGSANSRVSLTVSNLSFKDWVSEADDHGIDETGFMSS